MAITIDITKAKEVWKNKIRVKRTNALTKLDIDYMRAQEAGSDTTSIVADKQALRDLPSSHESTTNINDVVFPTQPD